LNKEHLTKKNWGEGKQEVQPSSWGFLDGYYLKRAYDSFESGAFEESRESVLRMRERNLEAELLLAHIYYKQEKYKLAKSILEGIKSSNAEVKQQLYYELGNCEAKLSYTEKAKNYYVKALQLGEDEDTLHNLKVVLFRAKKEASKVGYTNPSQAEKSNGSNENEEVDKKVSSSKKEEAQGGSGGSGSKKSKNSTVKVVKSDNKGGSKRVLSSKAYDLINEGYIREKRPW